MFVGEILRQIKEVKNSFSLVTLVFELKNFDLELLKTERNGKVKRNVFC